MGLGDFLNAANRWIDQRVESIPFVGQAYKGLEQQNQAVMARQATADQHPSFFKQWMASSSRQGTDILSPLSAHVGNLPSFQDVFYAATNRSWDTLFITSAHAKQAGGGDDSATWGSLFDRNSWARAWDLAGQPGHVTAGAMIAAQLNARADSADARAVYGADPMDAAGAKAIQDAADNTWYGTLAGGATDLMASMVVPGLGTAAKLAKASRAARAVGGPVHAEVIGRHFAEYGTTAAGHGIVHDTLTQYGTHDVLRGLVGHNADPASYVTAMQKFAHSTDGMDRVALMNHVGPFMEHSTDGAKAQVANLWAEANKIEDGTLRDQVKINTLLATQGSTTAKTALIEDAPLIAANLQHISGSPEMVGYAVDLLNARLADGESTVSAILDKHFGTAGHKAEIDALRDSLDKAELEAKAAVELRDLIRANKPTLKGFDAQRLQETRATALENTRRIASDLKRARADLEGSKRWATAAYKRGELTDVRDFHVNLGEKQHKVADLEAELAQARADRNLFHTTPLPGFEQLGKWRTDLAAARGQVREANANISWNTALKRQQVQAIAAKRLARLEAFPGLNLANHRLNDIFALGEDSLMTGRVAPTALAKWKGHMRETIGEDYAYRTGDGNPVVRAIQHPMRATVAQLAPRARGRINLVEVDLGRRQLEDALVRSRVYTPEEIRQAANDFISAGPATRGSVVDLHQERMLERMSQKLVPEDVGPLDGPDALKWAKELTGETIRHFKDGHAWTTIAAGEQLGKGKILVRDAQGGDVIGAFDEAMLRTDLKDNAPFLDPDHFKHGISSQLDTVTGRVRGAQQGLSSFNDSFTRIWKHGALLRPGLAARAALDTELRAWAMADTAQNLSTAIMGADHLGRNLASRALERVAFGLGKDPGSDAVRIMTRDLVPIKVKTGRGVRTEFAASHDAAHREVNMIAEGKGASITNSLQPGLQRNLGKYQVDRNNWDRYEPNSPKWELAYTEHAQKLVASPTGRRMAEMNFAEDTRDGAKIDAALKKDPAVRAEYRTVSQPAGHTMDEFLRNVHHEVEDMFPTRQIYDRARNRKLTVPWVRSQFPKETRFTVPGPGMTAIEQPPWVRGINKAMAGAYKNFLDKPDMWMSRNPTMANIYRQNVRAEVRNSLRLKGGEDLTLEEINLIDRRARLTAISDVRRTFFDTTRWNGAHEKVARLMPFFAAWEDAMTSWARLIYDDPTRLAKLQAGYNAAGTLNPWMPRPLLIDENGNAVQRGQHPDSQTYIAVPFKVTAGSKWYNPLGYRVHGAGAQGAQMRIRLQALNSIAQGDVWWFPGFGPQATVATTMLFGHVIPKDVALSLVSPDHPMAKDLMQLLYLDGEIPKSTIPEITKSVLPGYVRILANDVFGVNMARNTQIGFNKRIADATARGENVTQKQMDRFMTEAARDAQVAGVVRLVSSAGFGMTGSAVVDGQFYVDRMHEIEGMDAKALQKVGFDSPEEYFSHLYPEASELDWHMSRNVTGVNATVNAQTSAVKQNSIMKDYNPEVGWMVAGADNVGGEFSRTAYNQQVSAGGRENKTPAQMKQDTEAAVGWKQYNNFIILLTKKASELGLSMQSDKVNAVKRFYREGLMQENQAWQKAFYTSVDKQKIYTSQADKMAADSRLKNRADFVAYRDYRTARQQLLDYYQIKSLDGTSPEHVNARKVMNQVGEKLSAQNVGFMQMWNRFLARETEG